MRPTALAAGPLVPTVDSQRPLAPCHDASTGTKLSRHAPPSAHPVQNSPSTPETPLFGAFCASRENFVPLPPPPSRAGRIFYRIRNHLRYKTLPTRAPVGPTGTKLSRHARNTPFRRILRQQGELCTASTTTKPSRENFVPHAGPVPVQNSPRSQPRQAQPVQNSPDTQPRQAQPVQNSPDTPEIPLFGAFCASRESFIPRPPPPDQAGRKKSRTGRAKRGGASPYSPRNALIAGISRTAWTRPAR